MADDTATADAPAAEAPAQDTAQPQEGSAEPQSGGQDAPETQAAGSSDQPSVSLEGDAWKQALESLPDDLKGSESLANTKSLEDLTRQLVNAQSLVGKDKIALPGEDASEEEVNAFYHALGKPESPEGYEFPDQGLAEGFEPTDEFNEGIRQAANEANLTKDQAAKLYRAVQNQLAQGSQKAMEAKSQMSEQGIEALKGEWGQAFDQNVNFARDAVENFGSPELKALLDDSGLGNHPEVVKAFAKVGRTIAEDEIKGLGSSGSFKMSRAEAQAELDKFHNDPEMMEALTTKHHPKHDEAVNKHMSLNEAVRA